jgi:gas vesicle protein
MNKIINFVEGAFLGALLGSALALILAPSTGDQFRRQMKSKVESFRQELMTAGDERREELEVQLAKLRQPLPLEPKS